MSYKERRTNLQDGLGKRPGFCWHPQGCNGDITVHMRPDVLQHPGPNRYATSPEDRREAWAELRWRRHGCRQPSGTRSDGLLRWYRFVLARLLGVEQGVDLGRGETKCVAASSGCSLGGYFAFVARTPKKYGRLQVISAEIY